MAETLRGDILDLHRLDMSIDDIDAMDADPILSIRYGCVNWVRHFHQIDGAYNDGFRGVGRID
jgi:hypothetical protein